MTQGKGLIFDIQGFSVHDGPGCRSLVFLSGCPLRCGWCSNPEGQELRQRVMYRTSKCNYFNRNCRRCISSCPYNAVVKTGVVEQPITIDVSKCNQCGHFECTKACIYEALALAGKWMTVGELMEIIRRDMKFWGDGGGVTFTGGEPFHQHEFLLEVLKTCKAEFIHTSIETSAYVHTEKFLNLLQSVDVVFTDIKHMEPEMHLKGTGVRNDIILKNIRALAATDWPGLLVIRIPIIEGYNDTDENITATAEFLKEINLDIVNILPFHCMGDSKYKQLGIQYKYSDHTGPSLEKMKHVQKIFLEHNIGCFIGSNTPF
ncbi:MAG: 4-hydroxyphenylacetate decarboxylase activase [Clostridia bacterium]|nr:4-hydroxyphenylacetate decarboxylase activase [Clostridia bacterium]